MEDFVILESPRVVARLVPGDPYTGDTDPPFDWSADERRYCSTTAAADDPAWQPIVERFARLWCETWNALPEPVRALIGNAVFSADGGHTVYLTTMFGCEKRQGWMNASANTSCFWLRLINVAADAAIRSVVAHEISHAFVYAARNVLGSFYGNSTSDALLPKTTEDEPAEEPCACRLGDAWGHPLNNWSGDGDGGWIRKARAHRDCMLIEPERVAGIRSVCEGDDQLAEKLIAAGASVPSAIDIMLARLAGRPEPKPEPTPGWLATHGKAAEDSGPGGPWDLDRAPKEAAAA